MAKAHVHAESSARRFGGKWEDYFDIHNLIDSSRAVFGDVRHRTLTHNTWFIATILPRVFGETRVNSDGGLYAVKEIGEQHILEDYQGSFIPTPQDFLEQIPLRDWMDNGLNDDVPPSRKAVADLPRRGPTVSRESPWHEGESTKEGVDQEEESSIWFDHGPCGGPGVLD